MNLFRSFLIVLFFTFSLHAADECTSVTTADHTFTSVPNNIFSDTGILPNNEDKYYYFQVPGPGTITFTAGANASSYSYLYGLSSCPTTTTAIASGGTIEINSGDTDFNFRILANQANKTFLITLTFAPAPVVSISCPSSSIVEGNTSNTSTTCTISLSATPTSGDIELIVQGIDVTSSNGTDYNATSTNITFLQNTTTLSQNYSFDIIGDLTYETDEVFNIRVINNPAFSSATQLRQLPADYPITILNDDPMPSLTISIGNTSKEEGDVGTFIMNFPITLNALATSDITVTYRFNDINTSIGDTNMTNGDIYSFIIPSGTDVGLYAAPLLGVVGDTVIESDEIFSITLLSTSDGVITNNTATGTILDDDGGGGIVIPAYNPGTVDTVDVYTNPGVFPFYEQVIRTKIAGQTNLTLDAIYLGLDLNDLQPKTYTAANMPVIMYLYDAITGSVTKLYEQNNPNEPLAAVIETDSKWGRTPLFTMPATASKEAYIIMKYLDYSSLVITGGPTCLEHSSTGANAVPGMPSCVASDVQYLDAFHQEAYDRCKVQHGEPCKPSHHGYSGGGDPTYPGYDPEYDHKYGCYECTLGATPLVRSIDNFAIRPDTYTTTITGSSPLVAGQDFNMTTIAEGFNNVALSGYDGVAAVLPQTQIDTCTVPDGNLTNSSGASFNSIVFDGVDTNVTNNIKFGDVGAFDMNITDSTWTAVDSAKTPIECIDGSNTNVLDVDGKVGCLVRTTANPIVIPDHFDVDGNITNGSNGFTYLLNFENNASLDINNISALLDVNVTAKAFDINTTTLNYSNECYAKDGNSTITFNLAPAPDNLTKLFWYDDNNVSILGSSDINTSMATFSHPAERFTNGVGNLKYRLNFDRNVTKVVNPFLMTISPMDVEDNESVTGSSSIDNNATYLFGRTHASRQRYEGPTGTANIYFESFCFGADCNKTLLNGISPNMLRTDDVRWYVNEVHAVPDDGNTGTAVEKDSIDKVREISETIIVPPNSRVQKGLEYKYNGTNYDDNSYPYRTTMQNEASLWLIYNEDDPFATRNEFQVEFNSQGDWTGEHNTSTTTKSDNAIRTNRRIMW